MARRKLFPLRRCPGLVPLPEIDNDVVVVVGDRRAEPSRPTLVGYVDTAALRAVLEQHARNFAGAST